MNMWARGCGRAYGVLQGGAEGLIQNLCEQGHVEIIFVDLTITFTHHLMYQGLHKQKFNKNRKGLEQMWYKLGLYKSFIHHWKEAAFYTYLSSLQISVGVSFKLFMLQTLDGENCSQEIKMELFLF